jgi:hypothetical protein
MFGPGQIYSAAQKLTSIDALSRKQYIPIDRCSATENGIALAHVAEVGDELPHRGIVYGHVLDVNGSEGETSATKEGRCIGGIWMKRARPDVRKVSGSKTTY